MMAHKRTAMIVPLFRGLFDGLRANRNSVRVASCLVMEHMICLESALSLLCLKLHLKPSGKASTNQL